MEEECILWDRALMENNVSPNHSSGYETKRRCGTNQGPVAIDCLLQLAVGAVDPAVLLGHQIGEVLLELQAGMWGTRNAQFRL